MLDKKEVLKGRESEIWFSGYAEGSKDAVCQMVGAATAYEEANPEEINSQAYQKGYSAGVKYMYYNIMQKLYEEDKPLTLDEFAKQEELCESIGEPMTQEELDDLHCVEDDYGDDFFENSYAVWYDYGRTEGVMQGRDIGYEYGFEKGYEEAEKNVREYNVVLSGEFLAEVKDFSNKILSYQKKGEKDHNFMLYDINHALMNVVESWAMEQIYAFWSSSCEDDDDEEDEIE